MSRLRDDSVLGCRAEGPRGTTPGEGCDQRGEVPLTSQKPRVLVEGLGLPESPRWRFGKLWFVDMFGHRVASLSGDEHMETLAEFDDQTSGIGFLDDNTLIVVLKKRRVVMRIDLETREASVHADLSWLEPNHLNDMIVDSKGRAYVDTNSYILGEQTPPEVKDRLTLVDRDGSMRVVAESLMGPNGLAISEDGRRLYVAEIRGRTLSTFDIDQQSGSLSNKRTFADTGSERRPDGICLDQEGALWYACPDTGEVLRVSEGGEVLDGVDAGAGQFALACCLGGSERRTLYIMSAETDWPSITDGVTKNGFVQSVEVTVPGAGVP